MSNVDVRDLIGHPGASREVHLAEPVQGLATPMAEVPADEPVAVDVLLESVVEGILVSGQVAGPLKLRCARCLKEFESGLEVGVRELFSPHPDAESDEYPIEGDHVNLEPMVRDAVVLQMPFSPLCRPDCLGLCERCGGDRNLGECACGPEVDPRWEGLELLLADLEPDAGSDDDDDEHDEPGPEAGR